MSSVEVLEVTDVPIHRKVWTRKEAHELADCGFPIASKLELVNGELLDRMGKKHPHVLWQTLIHEWLKRVFGAEYVQSESPIDVAAKDNPINEPEPDLRVTAKSVREYTSNPLPEDLRLVIEVSDMTVAFDLKVKAKLYARAGIVEYWVVNIPAKKVIVHRDPQNGAYASVATYASDEYVTPLAAPNERFCLDRI